MSGARWLLSNPCPLAWDELEAGEEPSRRRCGACRREVHHLSRMQPSEVEALLTGGAEEVCVAVDRVALRGRGGLVGASLGLVIAGCTVAVGPGATQPGGGELEAVGELEVVELLEGDADEDRDRDEDEEIEGELLTPSMGPLSASAMGRLTAQQIFDGLHRSQLSGDLFRMSMGMPLPGGEAPE